MHPNLPRRTCFWFWLLAFRICVCNFIILSSLFLKRQCTFFEAAVDAATVEQVYVFISSCFKPSIKGAVQVFKLLLHRFMQFKTHFLSSAIHAFLFELYSTEEALKVIWCNNHSALKGSQIENFFGLARASVVTGNGYWGPCHLNPPFCALSHQMVLSNQWNITSTWTPRNRKPAALPKRQKTFLTFACFLAVQS